MEREAQPTTTSLSIRSIMNLPEQAAQTPQPNSDPLALPPEARPQHTAAPQSWMVRVADAKYHWYDLVAGFIDKPDIRDPIGRYLRRTQFELEAVAEKRHLFFAVTRPRVRFDVAGAVQWGFFSLKLTLPLLIGGEQAKDHLTIELTVPFAATLKKPAVTLTENFITLNWGGFVEALSIHDVLQHYAHQLRIPNKVVYVGQTRDPEALLSKGRLPALQKLRAKFGLDYDTLLLVQRMEIVVSCADGDPADLPHNAHPLAADALLAERMDVIEAAMIRYFEGAEESATRAARLNQVKDSNHLVQFSIDHELADAANYSVLNSEFARAGKRHLLSCFIADGVAHVAPMPIPETPKGSKS
jgi:hypothetical protein